MTTPRLLSERYELGETLGYGGMSEVHKGRDVRLGRDVAVKVLRADLARDPQFQLRFRREAQNAAALNHPAIVAVYDTGETNTEYGILPYIVMEFVDGRTLRDIVKTGGPMSETEALETMADVCAALDFSHRAGIIHRDVKPANVMITTSGAVKVMDFGIARALADGQSVTQTAAVIGTAQYLSPEQARGEQVDARSDVYAAGCVLYELVTGQPPFVGESPVAVAYQHVREDPVPPSRVNPDVSAAVDAVVLRSLSKNPANRYQSSAEMRSDLARVLAGQRPQAPMVMTDAERTTLLAGSSGGLPPRHRERFQNEDERPNRTPWILAGVAVAAVVALILLLFTDVFGGGGKRVDVPNVTGQTFEVARDTLIRAGFEVEQEPVASPVEQIDRVVETDPAAGSEAEEGSTVTVRVGSGPNQVTVPDLTGLAPEDARNALRQVGLELAADVPTRETDNPAEVGRIVDQDPKGQVQAAEGSRVTVTLGRPRTQVTVIDVTGSPIDQARRNLESIGLTVSEQNVDSARPLGEVVAQNPVGGTKINAGSAVTLSVSRSNQLEMPDLSGLTVQQAQSRLRSLGWVGQLTAVASPTNDTSQLGKVVNQDVAPGAPFARDQGITIDVASNEDGTTTTGGGILPGG